MKEISRKTGDKKLSIPISEKYMLSIHEASEYFNIGIKTMRRMAEENTGCFAIFMGNRYLIIREKFEKYIDLLTEGGEEEE